MKLSLDAVLPFAFELLRTVRNADVNRDGKVDAQEVFAGAVRTATGAYQAFPEIQSHVSPDGLAEAVQFAHGFLDLLARPEKPKK